MQILKEKQTNNKQTNKIQLWSLKEFIHLHMTFKEFLGSHPETKHTTILQFQTYTQQRGFSQPHTGISGTKWAE